MTETRDHGGKIDAAIARYGGNREDWIDLSTGINPVPYPLGEISPDAWTALPDHSAMERLISAARAFWQVPEEAQILAAPGASSLIARMPLLTGSIVGGYHIPPPTYNEHAAAFLASGHHWPATDPGEAVAHVYTHPNNPDGRLWGAEVFADRPLTVIDESFCDTCPGDSHIARAATAGVVILKSFGKFWGLAGLRLGFAIARPETLAPMDGSLPLTSMTDALGPWPVAGPALEIGTRALSDTLWADTTRLRLAQDSTRLDHLAQTAGAQPLGGTSLFRLYQVDDGARWQDHLARHHIWSRTFPYAATWLRLGLPAPDQWDRLEAALATWP